MVWRLERQKANSNYNFNINELRTVQEYDATKVDCWRSRPQKIKKTV